mmetsp:Transcript_92254/g.260649  ORF Transcript_92254/g.260649 Transcript_92254/m.260649 type:complete len:340 (-) Transcript_92254:25-1044(-)
MPTMPSLLRPGSPAAPLASLVRWPASPSASSPSINSSNATAFSMGKACSCATCGRVSHSRRSSCNWHRKPSRSSRSRSPCASCSAKRCCKIRINCRWLSASVRAEIASDSRRKTSSVRNRFNSASIATARPSAADARRSAPCARSTLSSAAASAFAARASASRHWREASSTIQAARCSSAAAATRSVESSACSACFSLSTANDNSLRSQPLLSATFRNSSQVLLAAPTSSARSEARCTTSSRSLRESASCSCKPNNRFSNKDCAMPTRSSRWDAVRRSCSHSVLESSSCCSARRPRSCAVAKSIRIRAKPASRPAALTPIPSARAAVCSSSVCKALACR